MIEAGSIFLADIMLWLMYIVVAVAVGVMLFSAARSFWLDNHKNS
jgi:hypothetical protein